MVDEFELVLRRAQAGDEAAVARLWDWWNHRLVRFLSVRAGGASEDIASETWLSVAQSLGDFTGGEADFRAWLFTIARRRLIDWQRRSAVRPQPIEGLEGFEGVAASDDPAVEALEELDTQAVLAFIARLPEDQAEVILLRVLAGLDVARVAEIMGRRPGNVRVLQHRGLKRLRELSSLSGRYDQGVTR